MEHIKTPKVENVRLLDKHSTRRPVVGTLYLTATHLIFVDPAGKKETWILHMHIASVDKQPLSTSGSPLSITCKNFLAVTFVVPRERDCMDIYTSLQRLSQPDDLESLYAFHYQTPELPEQADGWDAFDLQAEYLRMGVPNAQWVLATVNNDYDLCDTYPRHVYVPAGASTHVLMGSAKFRSRGRLPVLSYLHRDNQAAICRCSQPLSGFSARCVEDERMLQAIRKANSASSFMYVVDTRPKINAMANRAAGKGYENENFYTDIKFQFLGIENIHVMRSSLQKMLEVTELKNPSMGQFLSGMEACGWLKHIKAIIDTAVFIAKAVVDNISVLVHCSDGWDRTAQTCGLASLILDPHYRTIDGFQTLIEKEWLSFGHKFTDRCGLIGTVDAKEVSPIFTQFLDSVWQLTQQFPQAFEFSERYLLTLHDHVYSCQFGTFIGNCEKDRVDLRLRRRTYSLWGHVRRNRDDLLNPFYSRHQQVSMPVLQPVTNPQSIRFWRGLYCRFDGGVQPRESVYDTVCWLGEHTRSVSDHGTLVDKRISSLCRLLGKSDDQLRNALLSLSSSESIDFRSLLLADSTRSPVDDPLKSPTDLRSSPGNDLRSPSNDVFQRSASDDGESGFEDGGSASLWRSATVARDDDIPVEDVPLERLLAELQSVAVEWKSLRASRVCGCATPFESHMKKNHCWRCGGVFCLRCIEKQIVLPGHDSASPVPVCKACYKYSKKPLMPSSDNLEKLECTLSQTSNKSS